LAAVKPSKRASDASTSTRLEETIDVSDSSDEEAVSKKPVAKKPVAKKQPKKKYTKTKPSAAQVAAAMDLIKAAKRMKMVVKKNF
jgi:hypothetical protein